MFEFLTDIFKKKEKSLEEQFYELMHRNDGTHKNNSHYYNPLEKSQSILFNRMRDKGFDLNKLNLLFFNSNDPKDIKDLFPIICMRAIEQGHFQFAREVIDKTGCNIQDYIPETAHIQKKEDIRDVLDFWWENGGKNNAKKTDKFNNGDNLHLSFWFALSQDDNDDALNFEKSRWYLNKCKEADGGKVDWDKIMDVSHGKDTFWSDLFTKAANKTAQEDKLKLFREMLDEGLDKESHIMGDNYKHTPLSMAISNDNVDMAKILLEKGGKGLLRPLSGIDAKSKDGKRRTYSDIIEYLQEKGSDEMLAMFKDHFKDDKRIMAKLEKKDKPVSIREAAQELVTTRRTLENVNITVNPQVNNQEDPQNPMTNRERTLRYGDQAPSREQEDRERRHFEEVRAERIRRSQEIQRKLEQEECEQQPLCTHVINRGR